MAMSTAAGGGGGSDLEGRMRGRGTIRPSKSTGPRSSMPLSGAMLDINGEPISIRVPFMLSQAGVDPRIVSLDLSVTTSAGDGTTARRKQHEFTITDPQDLCFLYTLALPEVDYGRLSADGRLQVDFTTFKDKFWALLEQCQDPADSNPYKAELELDTHRGTAVLKLVQTGPMGVLTHVTLNFVMADDTALISHLARRLRTFIDRTNELRGRSTTLDSTTSALREEIAKRDNALAAAESQFSLQLAEARSTHEREVSTLKHSYEEAAARAAKEHSEMTSKLQEQLHSETTALQETVSALQAELSALRAEKASVDGALEKTQTELEATTARAQSLGQEAAELRSASKELETRVFALDTDVRKRDVAVAALEQDLRHAKEQQELTGNLLDTVRREKEELRASVEDLRARCSSLQDQVRQAGKEVEKGNAIIRRREDHIAKLKSVIERRNSALRAQEADLTHANQQIKSIERDLAQEQNQKQLLADRLTVREQDLDELKKRLQDTDAVLSKLKEENDDMKARYRASLVAPVGGSPSTTFGASSTGITGLRRTFAGQTQTPKSDILGAIAAANAASSPYGGRHPVLSALHSSRAGAVSSASKAAALDVSSTSASRRMAESSYVSAARTDAATSAFFSLPPGPAPVRPARTVTITQP